MHSSAKSGSDIQVELLEPNISHLVRTEPLPL